MKNGWDLSVRLGYFVTFFVLRNFQEIFEQLGFERKARLFCDKQGSIISKSDII